MCREANIPLYMDGARLGYGLAAEGTDVTLKDIARLCDVFYIGGTKVGALFWGPRGETETVVRFVTSWATREEDVDKLIALL